MILYFHLRFPLIGAHGPAVAPLKTSRRLSPYFPQMRLLALNFCGRFRDLQTQIHFKHLDKRSSTPAWLVQIPTSSSQARLERVRDCHSSCAAIGHSDIKLAQEKRPTANSLLRAPASSTSPSTRLSKTTTAT